MKQERNKLTPVIDGSDVQIPVDEILKVRNRLARAVGQLNGVIGMIDAGSPCKDTVIQMTAASKAVDRATYALLLAAFEACQAAPDADSESHEALKKIFMSLA
ncbi:metal-sensitive transcriptional regulator [Arcanobacterium bovis]|uniref:Transcriptional regulator n=1 Tax=Arcanobacterium bovis TaxID=2529275 RepID=A0A4Q9V0B8_9ACTO|nr:metal-sensitive transcriptional regulator [Arcanobacterium bovis]TBW20905.1 transcriptional regulator [Arcanobacterium bovis]